MSLSTEALFTAVLGLQTPWRVERAELNTALHCIEFDVICTERRMPCPNCAVVDQGIHERVRRPWRHLDFFELVAWLQADIPRVACSACGKTIQVPVPLVREGSGFTLSFEAQALGLCKELPAAQAARHLRTDAKALWQRIEHHVNAAREKDAMSGVRHIGIDETRLRKDHEYVTAVHDLQQKRLLFVTEGAITRRRTPLRKTWPSMAAKPRRSLTHAYVCMDTSRTYYKSLQQRLPPAAICYDRFHVAAFAAKAIADPRLTELKHMPANPFEPAAFRVSGLTAHTF